jgi:hypothetical protein
MVLVKALTKEEMARHSSLIEDYFKETRGECQIKIDYHNNGAQKGIYLVTVGEESYMAAAGSRDQSRRLLPEYNLLSSLWNNCADFFPRPIAHYAPTDVSKRGDIFLMEFLPHQDLMQFPKISCPDFGRKFAYQLGQAVALVNMRTGHYSSEPHDGNILARMKDESLELKFVDAIQFLAGDIEDAVRCILTNKEERPESFRFIPRFREGLARGMVSEKGISFQDAYTQLEFMREYNDIF